MFRVGVFLCQFWDEVKVSFRLILILFFFEDLQQAHYDALFLHKLSRYIFIISYSDLLHGFIHVLIDGAKWVRGNDEQIGDRSSIGRRG